MNLCLETFSITDRIFAIKKKKKKKKKKKIASPLSLASFIDQKFCTE